jgi:hypothetical protein
MGRVLYIKWLANARRGTCRKKVVGMIPTREVNKGIPSWSELKHRRYTMQAAQVVFMVVMLGVMVMCLANM